jgi:hypothetical protein
MQFDNIPASSRCMQALDVLRDNTRYDAHGFQIGQCDMASIRSYVLQQAMKFELEAPAGDRVFEEAVDVRYLLHVKLAPKASWISVCRHSTFCAYPSPGEGDDRAGKEVLSGSLNLLIADLQVWLCIAVWSFSNRISL